MYVASHPRHHAETVAAALAAHKHVLCEPPLALSAAEAEPLVQLAQYRGLVLALNYTWRAAGAVQAVHDVLMADGIGEVLGGRIRNTRYLPLERQTWRLQGQGAACCGIARCTTWMCSATCCTCRCARHMHMARTMAPTRGRPSAAAPLRKRS